MKELLEKLLDESSTNLYEVYLSAEEWLHTGEWGFIDLLGKKDLVGGEDHVVYATKYLRKHGQSVPRHELGVIAKFLSLTKYVRYYIENEETGFSIVRPVNSSQLRTMRRLGTGQEKVFFEVFDKKGDSLYYGSYGTYGTGFGKLISHLRKMDLLENINESSIDFPGQLHTVEWGFISPSGGRITDIGDHESYATRYLKKHNLSIPPHGTDVIAKFQQLTGYIRYTIADEETGFTIVNPVTPIQIRALRKISRKDKDVWFDISDGKGDILQSGEGLSNLISILKKMDLLESIDVDESSIDFPQKDLDDAIWDKHEDGTYTIKPEVKKKILDVLGKYPDMDIVDAAVTIHIVGSMGTNQYTEDADLDVHVVISKDADFYGDEEVQVAVIHWFDDHKDETDGWIEKHRIEVYLQYHPTQDLTSDSVYDMLADKWLVGPKIVPMSTDPYDDFSHIADDIRDVVQDADVLFGELKRDLIDYTVIHQAVDRMSGEDKEHLLSKLKAKLGELEDDIEALYAKRKEWMDARKYADKPTSPEQALKDIELAKKWHDINAQFKFINRYQYLKVIGDLEELLADEEISHSEVSVIKGIMGISND